MTIKNNSTTKIRSRDGCVRVSEIPGMFSVLSGESTTDNRGDRTGKGLDECAEMPNAPQGKKTTLNHHQTSMNHHNLDDRRDDRLQDEMESHKTSQNQLDRIDSPGDYEMGFEVEMSLRGSGSSNNNQDNEEIGTRRTICSEGSALDFPLDQLSGSFSKERSGVSGYNTQQNPENIISAIEQSLENAQSLKRKKDLFVDVNAALAPRHADRKDETPVTNNRSTRSKEKTPNFSSSPTPVLSLKSKKKEVVANTLATVVQEMDSPVKRSTSMASADGEDASTSSAEADARWEKLRAKYDPESVSDPSLPVSFESNSDDLNEDKLRDTLLDVNSGCQSPRIYLSGSSETFEDDLIQDCIDTGLPSPDKQRGKHDEGYTFSDGPSHSSSRAPTHENTSPKELTAKELLKAAKSGSTSSSQSGGEQSRRSISSRFGVVTKPFDNKLQSRAGSNSVRKSSSHEVEKEGEEEHNRTYIKGDLRNLILPKRSLLGYSNDDEDIPTPKIEISLMPSESNDSQPLSDISQSSWVEQENSDNKSYEDISQQAQERDSTLLPQRGLSWWRKNGKNLVNEKLHKTTRVEGNVMSSEHANRDSINSNCHGDALSSNDSSASIGDRPSGSKQGFESASISDRPSAGKQEFESAVKRGLSIFGNRINYVKERPPSPLKASRQNRESTKSAKSPELNSDQDTSTASHAPQPKPDDDSTNSVNNGRRQKTPIGPQKVNAVHEKEYSCIPNAPYIEKHRARYVERGRLSRPGHEDSGVDGALGLAPSPKRPQDIVSGRKSPAVAIPEATTQTETRNMDSPDTDVREKLPAVSAPKAPEWNEPRHEDSSDNWSRKKMIIAGAKRFFGGKDQVSKNNSQADDTEYTADILNVASTLTGETSTSHSQHPQKNAPNESNPTSTPLKSESDKQKANSTVWAAKHKKIPSLNAKGAASSTVVPSWRMAPAESLSDFTIQVYCTKSDGNEIFHVHKHILGVGPRRSEFLGGIFRSSPDASTKLTLVDQSLAYIPYIFDFAYCHDYELDLTTENVMPYRYLAEIFQISPLVKQTAAFILHDMKIENMSTYISESYRYNDITVTKIIAATCGEQIDSIEITDDLWTDMDPALFLQVISCPKIHRKTVSRQLSVLLVEYHTLHKYEMDATMFLGMASASILPLIDRKAAIPILEICEEYGTPASLQPLQKRCAQVVAYHWKTTSEMDRKRLFSLLRSLPSNFTVDFLEVVESGNGTALSDPAVAKVLKESNHTAHHNDYESAVSFTVEKLCGKRERNRNYLRGDLDRPLSWKMDPDRSFSDWTIKVKHKNDGKLDVYHVHKHMLSIGQYCGTFFADTFLSEDHKNSKKGSTMIELSHAPAKLIPIVFDFMYSPEHDLAITATTASALRFVARVFGMWMLNKKVVEHVEIDMDFANLLFYLEQAEIYDDERVKNIAVQKCAIGIRGIDPNSEILPGIKPDFFGLVIASGDLDKAASCHINILIAKYFTLHDLNETLLAELMKQVPMKEVDLESALKLLNVMSSVKSKGVAIFAEIRQRCAELLIDNWKTVRDENRDMTFRILRTLDATLVSEIFNVVENEYHDTLIETMSVQSRLVKRYRAKLEDAETLRHQDMDKMKEENDLVVSELLKKQQALEDELADYQDATSRRALRSTHSRIPSPRRSWTVSSPRQSNIPRLTTRRVVDLSPAPISNSEKANSVMTALQHARTPRNLEAPSRSVPKVNAPCEQQGSLFGSWFGCRPENPSDEERMDDLMAMAKVLPSAQPHYQKHLEETPGRNF
jgi:hypothetical protein